MFTLSRLVRSLALSLVASILGSIVLSVAACSIGAVFGITIPSFLLIVL